MSMFWFGLIFCDQSPREKPIVFRTTGVKWLTIIRKCLASWPTVCSSLTVTPWAKNIGLGLLIFLTIKGFGFIFGYVIYLLALVIYGLLRVTNFISIGIEKVDKEVAVV